MILREFPSVELSPTKYEYCQLVEVTEYDRGSAPFTKRYFIGCEKDGVTIEGFNEFLEARMYHCHVDLSSEKLSLVINEGELEVDPEEDLEASMQDYYYDARRAVEYTFINFFARTFCDFMSFPIGDQRNEIYRSDDPAIIAFRTYDPESCYFPE